MELSRRSFTALTGGAALTLALAPGADRAIAAPATASADGTPHTVTFDKYSMVIDGRRVVLWSGEIHPYRLPSPSLWRDILQKLRANGYNAISIYVAWNYHSPAPGSYDFAGVRDLGLFLRMAAETGLYVILRPGPYINAEVDGGGFPGWLTTTAGTARTADPTYLGHVDEWLTAVDTIVKQHLYTTGEGTVVLYQLENEYASHVSDSSGRDYLAHLYAKVRADGIDVPLFHNDKGRNGYWTPGAFSTGGESNRYLYAFDGYPSPSGNPPDWGHFGTGGATGGATASPGTPGFLAEFGGGWFDPWGGAEFGGKGYEESRRTRDAAYERRFYLTNLANGIRIHNVYMTFGGTSWGWLPAPVVYTSYDYGAAIDEARNPTSKLTPMHQIGEMVQSVTDFAKLDRAADVVASDPAVKVYHLTNPDTDAHFYLVRNDTTAEIGCTLPMTTPTGETTVPLTVGARDAKLLAAGIALGRRPLLHTSAQPMLQLTVGRQDIAVLTGRHGDPVEAVIGCASEPRVTVLDGHADHSHTGGALRITTALDGLTRVLIEGGGVTAPLLLLFADDEASAALWRHPTPSGPVLVRGPALLRTAEVHQDSVRLTGDTVEECELEVWAPRGVREVEWNGRHLSAGLSASGSLLARKRLAGVPEIALPSLTGWRHALENPESAPDFDDADWTPADRTTSRSTTPVPAGGPVLFADDYGFHYGDVWYRGHFDDATAADTLSLSYSAGTQGLLMAWLDGEPLGTHRLPVPAKAQDTQGTWTATAAFRVPESLRTTAPHVLSVLVRRMAHDEDGGARDSHKAARGLTAADVPGATVAWRLLGASGTEDPVRGPLNTGGLYGERHGWHLPGFGDHTWVPGPATGRRQGVVWQRTTFALRIDDRVDASVGLRLDDEAARAYRVQIFLNGWNLGQYINDVGPQHTFVLPNGLLRTRGSNTLALAVLSDGTTDTGPAEVSLELLGSTAGGVRVEPVHSPGAD